jgi:hypothetical protein
MEVSNKEKANFTYMMLQKRKEKREKEVTDYECKKQYEIKRRIRKKR